VGGVLLEKKHYYLIGGGIIYLFILVGVFFIAKPAKLPSVPQAFSHQVLISSGTISAGDSLYDILINEGLSSTEILGLDEALKKVFDPKKFKAGDTYEILKSVTGTFECLRYYPNPFKYYVVESTGHGQFAVYYKEKPLEKTVVGEKMEINSSLWETVVASGESPEVAMKIADIFSWQVDFFTELRKGDIFRIIWEKYQVEGSKEAIDGRILAAQYEGKEGANLTAIFFEDKNGNQDYYSPQGQSLRRQFLRAPLNYRRISSYFSYNRFHPILGYYRPHMGIDYAAPIGTPVVSIGDGTVAFKGYKGGNGNLVIIRHNSIYTTTYGHLSKFASGVKEGGRVSQGQVIGYVGKTGLATGPHLDFRVKKYGQFVNFLNLKLPAAGKLETGYMGEFHRIEKERLSQLSALTGQRLALTAVAEMRKK
jgi:murein DD-endopeptidase MepM/ murein hydrolase activator NlpD